MPCRHFKRRQTRSAPAFDGRPLQSFSKSTSKSTRATDAFAPGSKFQPHHATPLLDPSDHAALGAFERLGTILRRDDDGHADTHIENLIHLRAVNLPALA